MNEAPNWALSTTETWKLRQWSGLKEQGRGMPLAKSITSALVKDSGCLAQHQAVWGQTRGCTRLMAKMGNEVAKAEAKERPYSTQASNKLSENTGEEEVTVTRCWTHCSADRQGEQGTSRMNSAESSAVYQRQIKDSHSSKSGKFLLIWALDARNWWVRRFRVWKELFHFTEPRETLEIIQAQKLSKTLWLMSTCTTSLPAAGLQTPNQVGVWFSSLCILSLNGRT